jgi:hypothetical protein
MRSFAIIVSLSASALGCSGTSAGGSQCGPDNCSTCCDANNQCVQTVSAVACGSSGFTCQACNSVEACYTNRCGPANPHYAFVTQADYNGGLASTGSSTSGGLAGGDNLCQAAATAAGLAGTFKAWLSDSATNAIDRLVDVGGWYTTGTYPFLIAESKAQLISGLTNVFHDEYGKTKGGEPWTGTKADGTKSTSSPFVGTTGNCFNWATASGDSGVTGLIGMVTGGWTERSAYQCQNPKPIHCFQQ